MTTDDLAWAPDACTLPTADRPLRLAEFDAVLRRVEVLTPTHARFSFAGTVDDVRDLAAREAECCSFFEFTVNTEFLDVRVPPAYADVLAALTRRVRAVE